VRNAAFQHEASDVALGEIEVLGDAPDVGVRA
jgi:hypothetical protein